MSARVKRVTIPKSKVTDGKSSPRISGYSIYAVAFISGAVVLLLEVLASRVLAPYLGTSFSVWVNIIGTILAALSLGYYFGGILADRNPNLLPYIFLAASAACCFLYLGRSLLGHFGALGLIWGSLLAAILFFAPPSLILGMVSPFLLKIAADDPDCLGRTSGRIYAFSTIGSLAGTFAGGFFLIPTFSIPQILVGLVLVLLGLSYWCARELKTLAVLSIAILCSLVVGSEFKNSAASKRTIFEKNSKYCNIRVNDVQQGDIPYRYLLLDGSANSGRFIDSPDPAMPYVDLSWRIIRTLKPSLQSAVALGGGAYSLPELIKTQFPDTQVTVVEIDPEVTATAKEFFLNDPRIPIMTINEDARVFLNENRKQFDLLYSDVYASAGSIPPSLSSAEAFELMRRSLKPDGIAVFNIISAREGRLAAVFDALFRTIKGAFPDVDVYTTTPQYPNEPQNIVVVGANQRILSDDATPDSIRRFRCRPVASTGVLLTDDYAPVDFLARAVTRASYPFWRSLQ